MTSLIIWDHDPYSEILSAALGKDSPITHPAALTAEKLTKADLLIVLCELRWPVAGIITSRQENYGIELVKNLRLAENLDVPVLFLSFQPLSILFTPETEILTATGHRYLQLPCTTPELIRHIQTFEYIGGQPARLSPMELHDIRSFYCRREGMLSHTLHALNHYLNLEIDSSSHDSVYSGLLTAIKQIYGFFRQDPAQAIAHFQHRFPLIHKNNITAAVHYITHLGNTLRDEYISTGAAGESDAAKSPHHSWKILLLDDEIDETHGIVRYLEKKGLTVLCTRTAAEALLLLDEDWRSTSAIMVVIADYRLYEYIDGVRHHQPLQGYQFLRMIAASDRLIRLVAFSGLERKFLLHSFRHYNLRTEIFSKNDYLCDDHTFNLFAEAILEMAEENYNAIASMPSGCAGFAKYLAGAYKEFRSHPEYRHMEADLSSQATHLVHLIQQQLTAGEPINSKPIEFIRSPLAKTRKDAGLVRFRNYLLARRLALWLHARSQKKPSLPLDARKIAEILTGQSYPTDAYRQILSTNLGLSLEDFPGNILLEEKNWLEYALHIPVFREIAGLGEFFSKLKHHFTAYIAADKKLSARIENNGYNLEFTYRNSAYKINFDQDLTPILKTSTDIRVLYLLLRTQAYAKH